MELIILITILACGLGAAVLTYVAIDRFLRSAEPWTITTRITKEEADALEVALRTELLVPTRGFPLKIESLEPTLKFQSFSWWEWVGPGEKPKKHRRWVEWIREKVLRLPPRWLPIGWPARSHEPPQIGPDGNLS